MCGAASKEQVDSFIDAVDRQATGAGAINLVGGASAVWLAWRDSTIGIDIALAPEPAGLFGAIARLKRSLDVNIELASPDQFVPPLPGWQGRSEFIRRVGRVDFYHYDFYSQAFAKLSRGHARDLQDVQSMVRAGKVEPARLVRLVAEVAAAADAFAPYPALDSAALQRRLAAWADGLG